MVSTKSNLPANIFLQEESPGFPCLEEISLAVTSDNTSSSVTEEVVQR